MSFFVIAIMAPSHIILPAKSLVKRDESTIKADNGSSFGINTKYVLSSGINIESKLQVDKKK